MDEIKQLADMIRVQNETINLLEGVLSSKIKLPNLMEHLISEKEKEKRIAMLTEEVNRLEYQLNAFNKQDTPRIKSADLSASTFSKFISSAFHTENVPSGDKNTFVSNDTGSSFLVPKKEGIDKECSARYGQFEIRNFLINVSCCFYHFLLDVVLYDQFSFYLFDLLGLILLLIMNSNAQYISLCDSIVLHDLI